MFDEDAGGFIDSVEVEKLVVALLQLTEIEVDKEKTEVCVEVRERIRNNYLNQCNVRHFSRLWTRTAMDRSQRRNL